MAQSGKSSKGRSRRSTKPPSDEVLVASFAYRQRIWTTIQIIGGILAVGIVLLCAEPLASKLAGKNTNVDVNLSISVAITFGVTTAATGVYAKHQKKRADRLDSRNKTLVTALKSHGVSDVDIAQFQS